MRRLVLPIIVAFGLVMIGSSSAFADDPAPVVSAPATPGKKVCKIAGGDLDELSGIVATKTGYIVINDGSDDADKRRVFFLDSKCKVSKSVSYPSRPIDTEDMILSPDGKQLWIADIGDNNFAQQDDSRSTIALWTMPVNGSAKPVIHRLRYPEGDHHDAEALLLNGDGKPLIVTKEVGRPAYIYEPSGPLQKNNEDGVPLKRVGEITVSGTTTTGPPLARIGNKTIDGGAVLAGGSKVVLRTYTDALEWDVKNGDVLGALKEKPRTTGLPNEPQGEAITYSADGKSFLTVSDMQGNASAASYILGYTPATKVAAVAKGADADGGKKWYDGLSIGDLTAAVGGVGLIGLILVAVGVFGIVQHRKKVRGMPQPGSDDLENPLGGGPENELIGVGGAPQRAGVYGGAAAAPTAAARSGPVYGSGGPGAAGPASGQRGGGAPVYGRPQGQPPRGPQGQPPRGPQGQPPRGPQGQPARGPQPPRGPQGQPPRGPQGQPARAPQPPRGPQGQPPRGPQGQPPRGPQAEPPRGPQGQPPRGPQGQPPRGPQGQPPRGPQGGQPGRGGPQGGRGGGGVYGGQPSRGDGYSDYYPRREDRYDDPDYGRR